jgi:nucleoid DNA-binding protein
LPDQFTIEDLIRSVILETGLSRDDVTQVIVSFLSQVQESSCDKEVFIRGFGTFKTEVVKRRYYDINRGVMDDQSVSVTTRVKFTPSQAFLNMVQRENAQK